MSRLSGNMGLRTRLNGSQLPRSEHSRQSRQQAGMAGVRYAQKARTLAALIGFESGLQLDGWGMGKRTVERHIEVVELDDD